MTTVIGASPFVKNKKKQMLLRNKHGNRRNRCICQVGTYVRIGAKNNSTVLYRLCFLLVAKCLLVPGAGLPPEGGGMFVFSLRSVNYGSILVSHRVSATVLVFKVSFRFARKEINTPSYYVDGPERSGMKSFMLSSH